LPVVDDVVDAEVLEAPPLWGFVVCGTVVGVLGGVLGVEPGAGPEVPGYCEPLFGYGEPLFGYWLPPICAAAFIDSRAAANAALATNRR